MRIAGYAVYGLASGAIVLLIAVLSGARHGTALGYWWAYLLGGVALGAVIGLYQQLRH